MESITIHPKSKKQAKAFEQLARAFDVPFEKSKKESLYNADFVTMVKQADSDFKKGKGKKIKLDEIWK